MRNCHFAWTVTALCSLLVCEHSRADTVKDVLDAAKADHAKAQERADSNLLSAFDVQKKALGQAGDLDAVELLIAQRKAFVTARTLPSASSMRAAVAVYKDATASAESKLRAAYEAALADYTKAERYDDAVLIKRLIAERFAPLQASTRPSISTTTAASAPSDQVLDELQKAKQEFAATVRQAHGEVLAVIEEKAKGAADRGDLDGYKAYTDLKALVERSIFVPADVRDAQVQGANAKFVRAGEAAHLKLKAAYQAAIRDYTKARRIEEAEAIKAELGTGAWFEGSSVAAPTVDLLKAIDVPKGTIRRGWRMNDGILEPTAWNDEHGPWLEVPVSAKGSYELQVTFVLARAPEALYIHVPVGNKWGLLVLAAGEQTFENIEGKGQLRSAAALPPAKKNEARFRITLAERGTVRIALNLNGEQAITWEGPAEKVTNSGGVWDLRDNSSFGVGTKSGIVLQMQLKK